MHHSLLFGCGRYLKMIFVADRECETGRFQRLLFTIHNRTVELGEPAL